MTIRLRILTLIGAIALIAVAVTALSLVTLRDYDRMMDDYGRAYEHAFVGEKLNNTVSKVVMDSRGIYLSANPAEANEFASQLAAELDAMPALLQRWNEVLPEEHDAEFRQIDVAATRFLHIRRELVQLAREGRIAEARALGVPSRSDRIAFQQNIASLVDKARAELDIVKRQADQFQQRRTSDFLITAVVSILIVLGAAIWLVSHFITTPLQNIANAIVRTSHGDYDAPLNEPVGDDEVARVWRAIYVLREKSKEAERLAAEQAEANRLKEMELRQIMLD
ncbi:MCP four helix bundle domain-containing protein [Asticcacaulis tiandongensis]|uniref:MCP four helix bundle domain-containing protein n=1 Tax=Asticcacaulis tiandongensis TaxID=2565365 RepID=UPI00112E6F51|nr:MCP four helix bundle domain-containing protein [Asticcacaulis tiandongensis]